MKAALVFPPFYLESMYNLPPLGLVNLATALSDGPHQIALIDFVLSIRQGKLRMGRDIYGQCTEMILDQSPDIVGFSGQCTTYPAVLQISKKIKGRRPEVKVVIGGHNASFVDRRTLEAYPFVDAIVRGEGEKTFRELVDAYEAGKDEKGIPGVTYRSGDAIFSNKDRELIPHLDDLPLPDYSFSPSLEEYRDACRLPRSIAVLEVGRGCPHRCIYCSESVMWRQRTRTFSVSRLVREMENLSGTFGAECFLLAYDQFTAKRSFVESFCREVIRKGLNHIPWYCISRLDSVDASLLALMREAGCESMCYGIDSGSKRTLSFIRKRIDHGILYERVVETADQGIIPTLSFVIGFPEEEKRDMDETLWMALRTGIVGNNNPLIQLPTVLPGTDLQRRYGHRLVREVDTYFALGLEFEERKRTKSDEEMINSDAVLFSSFYNLPSSARPLKELNLIATYFPLVVRFYPKTFLVLSLKRRESVSDLFIRWLKWLRDRLHRKHLALSPQDCYLHFGDFVEGSLNGHETSNWKHLSDVLRYERLSLEVGKFRGEEGAFHIDLDKVRDLKPLTNKRIIIERFDFNLPMIIMDLKAGEFKTEYPSEVTSLLFRQDGDLLDVSEINPFAEDFLRLCDGGTTLEVISKRLYGKYGHEMDPEAFFDACVEAYQVLGERRFLESG